MNRDQALDIIRSRLAEAGGAGVHTASVPSQLTGVIVPVAALEALLAPPEAAPSGPYVAIKSDRNSAHLEALGFFANDDAGMAYVEASPASPDVEFQVAQVRMVSGFDPFNLKAVLMALGNRLVMQHGYQPATHVDSREMAKLGTSTAVIAGLTAWINAHQPAQDACAALGFAWPVTAVPSSGSPADADVAATAPGVLPDGQLP